MPGIRRVEAVKGKKEVKKSFLRKAFLRKGRRREGFFLHFNETILVLFITKSINLNEDVKIAHSKNGKEELLWQKEK